jgi:hypothetical protein
MRAIAGTLRPGVILMMDVHQCPRCELRFLHGAELRDHFSLDHGAEPDTFERYRYGARRSAPEDAEVRHYLVVANQTLVGEHLERAVLDRAAAGPARFSVLVPATHSALQSVGPASPPPEPGAGAGDDAGLALARWRMRSTLDRLAAVGVDAEGQVGHPDPVRAVLRFLPGREVDEILLSTLPAGVSRWLALDLPAHLARRARVPVTTLTAEFASSR